MKILHVLDTSLPSVAGYTQRAHAILESQAALGLHPIALTGLRQRSPGNRETIGEIDYFRTRPPIALASASGVPVAREVVEMAALGRRALEVARAERADLVHAHSPVLCGIPGVAAARRLGLPGVYEIRAFWEDAAVDQGRDREGAPRYRAIRAAEARLARAADAVVAICEGIRRDLEARGVPRDQIFVVPNGVDPDRFTPRPRDAALAAALGFEGKTVVGYVGSLFRFEGVPRLVEALARILGRRDDVRAFVAGGGETEPEVRALCEARGLGNRVAILGKVRPEDVPRCYALADVLVYPRERSRITELTTPLKPLEAMSMGKAVIASDVGGLRELVRDGATGLLFEAGNEADLARVIERAVDAAELRRSLGDTARMDVARTRSWRAIAALYDEVYAAAAERNARRLGTRVLRLAGAA